MDRFPPAENGPRYEMQSVGRTLSGPDHARTQALTQRDLWVALISGLAGLLTVTAFIGWLFATSPVHA